MKATLAVQHFNASPMFMTSAIPKNLTLTHLSSLAEIYRTCIP
jgi:hypothetical protein